MELPPTAILLRPLGRLTDAPKLRLLLSIRTGSSSGNNVLQTDEKTISSTFIAFFCAFFCVSEDLEDSEEESEGSLCKEKY